MATIRHAVRRALRDSTLGRYDRTYRRPHRRQACYGEFIMASYYQPRPRPGFLIDTSNSMENAQLARAVAELGGLTRQLGYGAEVAVACCDAAVHDATQGVHGREGGAVRGRRHRHRRRPAVVHRRHERRHRLLIVVTDCHTPWPEQAPPFPVITIRVGDGVPPPWGNRGTNKVITIEESRHLTMPGSMHEIDALESPPAGVSARLASSLAQAGRLGTVDGRAPVQHPRVRHDAHRHRSRPAHHGAGLRRLPCVSTDRAALPTRRFRRGRDWGRLPDRRAVRAVLGAGRGADVRARGVVPVGVVERGRAQADHRRLPEAAARLVRPQLARPAHLAVGARGVGLRLHRAGCDRDRRGGRAVLVAAGAVAAGQAADVHIERRRASGWASSRRRWP